MYIYDMHDGNFKTLKAETLEEAKAEIIKYMDTLERDGDETYIRYDIYTTDSVERVFSTDCNLKTEKIVHVGKIGEK